MNLKYGLLTVALTVCLVFSLTSIATTASITDIKGHWAQEQIDQWVTSDRIAGYPDGNFRPNRPISRAEFVALVNRAFDKHNQNAQCDFSDVSTSDWFYQEVSASKVAGYISGYPDGTFKPHQAITRQEAAAIVTRLLDLSTGDEGKIKAFKDYNTFSEWSKADIGAVVSAKIMYGLPDGTFGALKPITRAETVVTLDRALITLIQFSSVKGIASMGGQPLEGALVRLFAENGKEVLQETTTDKDGKYEFNVQSGRYDLTVVKNYNVGYIGGVIAQDKASLQEIILVKGARIGGRLLENNKPLANTKVVFIANPCFIETTDPNGNFSIILPIVGNNGQALNYNGSFVYNNINKVFLTNQQFNGDTDLDRINTEGNNVLTSGGGSTGGTGDTTPPVFAVGYPKTDNVTKTSLELLVRTNEGGKVYFVVVSRGSTAPNAEQVKNGQDSTGTPVILNGSINLTANNETRTTIGGLTAATNYDIYVIAEDTKANLQMTPEKLMITTNASPPGDTTPLVLKEVTVDSITLTLYYNLLLNTLSIPMASDFTVAINGLAQTPSHVSISGNTAILTLPNSVGEGDTVNLSYAPGSKPIRDAAGNLAAPFSNKHVTNISGSLLAPELDLTAKTSFSGSTAFLYTGSNPIQTGVAPGTIQTEQAAVLRGKVLNRDGTPIPGAKITILNNSQFGSTLTRADGMFDLAANGGNQLTVNYIKDGYLSIQRQVEVPLQNFVWLPDVVMIPCDHKVTPIVLGAGNELQVAQGSRVSDADGSRQATILFPQGTTAEMVLPDGTRQPLTSLNVRATEYTVGDNGPQAMPAELPVEVGYTYALEYSVDEATAAGAINVCFNQPIYHYVENFLNFPVGGIVPVGYYDREQGAWIASKNGRIVQVLSINNGLAELDIDGSGTPADSTALEALGVSEDELERLATLYQPGQSLWRVPITHFTPYDLNWPVGPPDDATPPDLPPPTEDEDDDEPCEGEGSIIEYQNMVLGETAKVYGTPFTMHYRSSRIFGHKNRVWIPLSGDDLPPGLKTIKLEIVWMGKRYTMEFPDEPNQWYSFMAEPRDAYGRQVQGGNVASVKVGYTYDGVYMTPEEQEESFGNLGGAPMTIGAREEVTLWQNFTPKVGSWDALPLGLGGWTLDVHHGYDPLTQKLYLGDGKFRKFNDVGGGIQSLSVNEAGVSALSGSAVISTIAGTQNIPAMDLVAGPDGNLYIAGIVKIYRVNSNGTIVTIAGTGEKGYSGDGGPAIEAQLSYAGNIAVGTDGSVYFSERDKHRVRRVDPSGIITTVVGTGLLLGDPDSNYGDGGPAIEAQLFYPMGVAVGPDNNLYIADFASHRIRMVDSNGIITTVAGTGEPATGMEEDNGSLAVEALLDCPWDIAFSPDGSMYIAESNRIRKVGTDGIINTVAGTIPLADDDDNWSNGDGGLAINAEFEQILGIAAGADGSLYVSDANCIRRIGLNGIINTVVGTGYPGHSGDGGPPDQARLTTPMGIDVGPDGSLYISDYGNSCIRKVSSQTPGIAITDSLIPSACGQQVYIFDAEGRHLRTVNALTGARIYNFVYDKNGRLKSITDGDNNITGISRNAAGEPMAIVAPGGQVTGLSVNTKGFLSSISCPLGYAIQLDYAGEFNPERSWEDGLLTKLTDHRDNSYYFTYDEDNRLIMDVDPAGGSTSLMRTDMNDGYYITATSGMGRVSTYLLQRLPMGGEKRQNTFPDGNHTTANIDANGDRYISFADGTTVEVVMANDPRWGKMAPHHNTTVTTPGGLKSITTETSEVELIEPTNPLAIKTLTYTVVQNGNAYRETYDSATGTVTLTTPEGRQVVYTTDTQGRVVKIETPGINPIVYTYNNKGQLSKIIQGNRMWQYNYENGNLVQEIDPVTRVTDYEYDLANRLIKEIRAGGREITYDYDQNGNLKSITPPGKSAHTFIYTPVNLKQAYFAPDPGDGSGSQVYEYNKDRQLVRAVFNGQQINYSYDHAGNLTGISIPGENMSYGYDLAGRLSSITADGVTLTYAYDGTLLTGSTVTGSVNGNISWTYNNDLELSSISVNGTQVAYQYDRDGLLTMAGNLSVLLNNQNGVVEGTELNGLTTIQGYNDYNQMENFRAEFNNNLLYEVQYIFDDLGRITGINETVAGDVNGSSSNYNYTYNNAGSLEQVVLNGSPIASCAYDSNGNRLSYMGQDGNISASFDVQDRLLQYGSTTYNYNNDGTLSSKTDGDNHTTSYNYDVFSNLRSVILPNNMYIDYLIDGKDRRVAKKANGVLVQGFLYQDTLNPVAELDSNNNVISRFIYATRSNVPDYMEKDGHIYRIISDHLGSPRLVVETGTGDVYQRLDYDAFGNVVQDTNPGFQPFGFAGGIYDQDTKLVRFGARDYDPELGRWTSKEPLGFTAGDTNLYVYSKNDMVNLVDPTGLDCINAGKTMNVTWTTAKLKAQPKILLGGKDLSRGTKVTVTDCDKDYYKVRTEDGEEGWVSRKQLDSGKITLKKVEGGNMPHVSADEVAIAGRG